MKTVAEFDVSAGERMPFALNYRPSHEAMQPAIDPEQALTATENGVARHGPGAAPTRDAGTTPWCAR